MLMNKKQIAIFRTRTAKRENDVTCVMCLVLGQGNGNIVRTEFYTQCVE